MSPSCCSRTPVADVATTKSCQKKPKTGCNGTSNHDRSAVTRSGKTPLTKHPEECLMRIAAHVCRLQECDSSSKALLQEPTAPSLKVEQRSLDTSCRPAGEDVAKQVSCCSSDDVDDCAGSESPCCTSKEVDDCVGEIATCCSSQAVASISTKKECTGCDTDECCGEQQPQTDTSAAKGCQQDCCATGGDVDALVSTQSCCGDSCSDKCCETPDKPEPRTACPDHLKSAFERYEALLRAGRCLCRKVLNDLNFCCCSPTSQSAGCATHESAAVVPSDKIPTGQTSQTELYARCSLPVSQSKHHDFDTPPKTTDVESSAARQHISVGVIGMTCTGCVKKLSNVMGNMDGLSNATVSFVSGTAEFEVDSNASVKTIISRIENETGFKLSRTVTGLQTLDVVMTAAAAQQYRAHLPLGVNDFEQHKHRYRIIYNPDLIGARAVLSPDMKLAPPMDEAGVTEGRQRLYYMLWSFTASTVLTIPVLVLNWSETHVTETTKGTISCVLATLVQAIAVPNFYIGAFKSLVHSRVVEMDMLVVISITAAYVYSVVAFALTEAGVELETKAFFETSTLLITLVLLGRLLTSIARVKAIAAVSVRSLQSEKAMLVSEHTAEIDARLLQLGDTIRVLGDSRIVTDGKVVSGQSTVDESMITGESRPVLKRIGDPVIAGTMNGAGTIDVRLTRLPGQNSITDIAQTVQDALKTKPKVQELADKLAGHFVPVVIAIGLVVFLIWIAVSMAVRKLNGGSAVGTSITYTIAVLAVSCPCALGLAVPMVLVIAGAVSARNGVVIRSANTIERGHRTTDVVFDKTGTLTEDALTIAGERAFESVLTKDQAMALTGAMVEGNAHPVSKAIQSHVKGATITLHKLQSIPGAGFEASWCGSHIRAGNPYWLGVDKQPDIAEMLSSMSVFCVTVDGQLALAYGLRSVLRQEAASVIADLQRRGIACHVVSGDTPMVVEHTARQVGISLVRSRCVPSEKQKYIQDLQATGKKVVFVGDGTNDAAAVAQADIGVQIGSASDVTKKVADVVLLGGLDGIQIMLDISRRAWWRICFNFAWSGVYNVFAILLAAGAFVTFRLPPAYAGLGEIVSVAPVIFIAATLVLGKMKG